MRNISSPFFFAFFLLYAITARALPASVIDAESAISAVIVYQDRAKVTRESVVRIPEGESIILLQGLPASIETDSLRVEGKADGKITLGAIAYKLETSSELAFERERILNSRIEEVQDQIAQIDADVYAVKIRKAFIEKLTAEAARNENLRIATGSMNPEDWSVASAALQSDMKLALSEELALIREKRSLERESEKLSQEIAGLKTNARSSFKISIPVESLTATRLKLNISYTLPQASWKSVYDARLDTETGDLALTQYGIVSQKTGEDWNGVALRLSSARPERGTSLPDLTPYWIDIGSGSTDKSGRATFGAGQSTVGSNIVSFNTSARESGYKENSVSLEMAEIETGKFVQSEYKIVGSANIPSDGTETKLKIRDYEMESNIEFHVKPQLAQDAYLVSRVILKGESSTLAGDVNLFRNNAFVGASSLRQLRPGEEHLLFFGIDDKISVERDVLLDETKESTIIGTDNSLKRRYITTIKNYHSEPITLVVKETIPVSKNSAIKVQIDRNETTSGYSEDSSNITGMLHWRSDLGAGEEKAISLGWDLRWPRGQTLRSLRP